jgi:biopolymer transport protein TolR
MARRTTILALEQIREINMTPLIDLTFILLITFIITFPLIEQGIPVNLPRGNAADLDPSKTRTITLNLQGELFLDDRSITRDELAAEMNQLGHADPEITILVRADDGIQYGKLVDVLRVLHDAKIARMALVTAPDAKQKP